MSFLSQLYNLEIEFHRQFRHASLDAGEAWSAHTSYALQHGYERLLRSIGVVDPLALESIRDRMSQCEDPRDVMAAFHSLRRLSLD